MTKMTSEEWKRKNLQEMINKYKNKPYIIDGGGWVEIRLDVDEPDDTPIGVLLIQLIKQAIIYIAWIAVPIALLYFGSTD